MNGQKGISTLSMIIIIVGLIVVVGVGLFIYQYLAMQQTGPTACTEEAKVCPDGSTVSRIGPNCEFAPCPTGISVDSLNNATLSYPNPYDVSKTDTFVLVNGKTDVIYDTGNMKPRIYTVATTAIGDLDGDGVADGAIGIYQGYGANIIVPIVFVFSNKNGVLTQIDSVLPDTSDWNYETQIKSLSIDNGVLSVNLLVLAEKDQSLPHYQQQASVEKTVQYKLIDGKLVVQSDLTAGWKTYTNTQYGFEIKYPTNWVIFKENTEVGEHSVWFGPEANYVKNIRTEESGCNVILVVFNNDGKLSLSDWIEKNDFWNEKPIKGITPIRINGIEGIKYEGTDYGMGGTEPVGFVPHVLFSKNYKIIDILMSNKCSDNTNTNKIVSTFKFTK